MALDLRRTPPASAKDLPTIDKSAELGTKRLIPATATALAWLHQTSN